MTMNSVSSCSSGLERGSCRSRSSLSLRYFAYVSSIASPPGEPGQKRRGREQGQGRGQRDGTGLAAGAAARLGVRNQREGDHHVEGDEPPGEQAVQPLLERLLQKEQPRSGVVLHLLEVGDRQVGERVGVLPAQVLERGEGRPGVARVAPQAVVEDDAVLEGGVGP